MSEAYPHCEKFPAELLTSGNKQLRENFIFMVGREFCWPLPVSRDCGLLSGIPTSVSGGDGGEMLQQVRQGSSTVPESREQRTARHQPSRAAGSSWFGCKQAGLRVGGTAGFLLPQLLLLTLGTGLGEEQPADKIKDVFMFSPRNIC